MTEAPQALVVDDNALNARLAATLLGRLGWEARIADDGRHALALLARQSFDVVLLDPCLPLLDGEELCRHIRRKPQCESLPVIAYTGHGHPQEAARLLASGFDRLLAKPTSFNDLRLLCQQYAPAIAE
ncbi:response regulator [Azohydromonas caseinilytica]|uniref:Response regulator n=1 Tax=Azohydromonas caseinilytica TaxID=2728836 RepID=A0A848F9F8_9BURK|nr:response regulator [Azohydromonas caseinilytica]NML16174.1 response regulator [Azohydromonas caseinilytica]